MNKMKIFCFGFGQVAESFINKLIFEKKKLDLNITSREETHEIEFNNLRISSYKFNNENYDENLKKKVEEAQYILVSVPPTNGKDPVISNFQSSLKKSKHCKWITYLSATSVYGNHNGEWVDEKSSTNPTSQNGIDRLIAEKNWKDFSIKNHLPLQIFRLAGIYSNEYNVLKRLKIGKAQTINKKNHFFSRIHVEDISNILFESLKNFKNMETYNICDDMPATQSDVNEYAAKLLKIETPKPIDFNDIENEMLKNFYRDSKKVDNKKMKKIFNYKLKYPSYVDGLKSILNNFL